MDKKLCRLININKPFSLTLVSDSNIKNLDEFLLLGQASRYFTEKEYRKIINNAKEFFYARYGFDVFSMAINTENCCFGLYDYLLNPKIDYKIGTLPYFEKIHGNVDDTGIVLILNKSLVAHGTYGGEEGILLPKTQQLYFGEYRLHVLDTEQFIKLPVCSCCPKTISMENPVTSRIHIFDSLWGNGDSDAIVDFYKEPNSIRVRIRTIISFPSTGNVCDKIKQVIPSIMNKTCK